MPKIVIKKVENNEEIYETIDQKIDENNSNLNNEQIIPKKRSRGRPKKNINSFDNNYKSDCDLNNELKTVIKVEKNKEMDYILKRNDSRISRNRNKLGKSRLLRAKNLFCQWPGCEQRFRGIND
jgi:hypothetical protein